MITHACPWLSGSSTIALGHKRPAALPQPIPARKFSFQAHPGRIHETATAAGAALVLEASGMGRDLALWLLAARPAVQARPQQQAGPCRQ